MEVREIIKDGRGRHVGWQLKSDGDGRVSVTHRTVMRSEEFKLLLTRKEFNAFRTSTDPLIVDTVYLLINRNGVVDTESQIFADVMEAAVLDRILSQDRSNELSLGIPI